MLDTILISGDEAAGAQRIKEIFGWGVAEILASVVTVGTDREASARRTMKLLAYL